MGGLIAIATEDFSLFHDLVRLLRERGEPFVSLRPGDPVPSNAAVVVCSAGEAGRIGFAPVVEAPRAETALLKALSLKEDCVDALLVAGVDPGMRPGYALMMKGRTLAKGSVDGPEGIAAVLRTALQGISPPGSLLRIGHGDPVNRDRCIRAAWPLVDEVQVVDETRTSGKSPLDHREAAEAIARSDGRRLADMPRPSSTSGGLRDLQRVSRRVSGDITISAALAEEVALGGLSMDEAIERQRLRAGARRPGPSL